MIYLAVASVLLIFLAAVLLIPFHISLNLFKEGTAAGGEFSIKWLRLRCIHRKISFKERKKEKKEEEGFEPSNLPETVTLLAEALPHLPNILRTLMRSFSIEKISADITVGLDSPVDTAIVSGYLWSLAPIVNILPNTEFALRPDFQEERLDGALKAELKVRVLWIIVAFIKAGTKKPVRHLFARMRR